MGRKTSWDDRLIDKDLKVTGFNRYITYKARSEGIGTALITQILPPVNTLDAAFKDTKKIFTGDTDKGFELPSTIPVGGKLYYWWFGKGRSKEQSKQGTGAGSLGVKIPKIHIITAFKKLFLGA